MATVTGVGWAGGTERPAQRVLARRRRTVLGVLGTTVFGCVALAGGLGTGSTTHSPPTRSATSLGMAPVGAKLYVVQPGDTLWLIANRLVGNGDPRPLMQSLAPQLPGGVLQVGQRLVLP